MLGILTAAARLIYNAAPPRPAGMASGSAISQPGAAARGQRAVRQQESDALSRGGPAARRKDSPGADRCSSRRTGGWTTPRQARRQQPWQKAPLPRETNPVAQDPLVCVCLSDCMSALGENGWPLTLLVAGDRRGAECLVYGQAGCSVRSAGCSTSTHWRSSLHLKPIHGLSAGWHEQRHARFRWPQTSGSPPRGRCANGTILARI